MSEEAKKWVIVARVLGARGNKGEVAAELLTDFPERLTKLTEVFLARSGDRKAEPQRVAVRSCWLSQNHKGQAVFHFAGSDSISAAEEYRGAEIFLRIEQRVHLEHGHYFVDDLVGCVVFEIRSAPSALASSPCSMETAPALLGTVRDVQFVGEDVAGTPVLAIDAAGGELLIPLAEDICRSVKIAERRIEVSLPDGLRELNLPKSE